MPEPLNLKLPPNDVYGIIDALDYFIKSWEATEIFCRDGVLYDGPIHEDCHSAEDAHSQVRRHKSILRRFHQQLDAINQNAE
jgi:hypothetical protein